MTAPTHLGEHHPDDGVRPGITDRAQLIADSRRLVHLLETVTDLPVPAGPSVALGTGNDTDANDRLDHIEAALRAAGIDHTAHSTDFYRGIEIPLGTVTFRITHVWAPAWERLRARQSYEAVVQVDEPAEPVSQR